MQEQLRKVAASRAESVEGNLVEAGKAVASAREAADAAQTALDADDADRAAYARLTYAEVSR